MYLFLFFCRSAEKSRVAARARHRSAAANRPLSAGPVAAECEPGYAGARLARRFQARHPSIDSDARSRGITKPTDAQCCQRELIYTRHCNRHTSTGRLGMGQSRSVLDGGTARARTLEIVICNVHLPPAHRGVDNGAAGYVNRIVKRRGGRARLNAPDSKSGILVRVSGVRIPPSPPAFPVS